MGWVLKDTQLSLTDGESNASISLELLENNVHIIITTTSQIVEGDIPVELLELLLANDKG